MRPRLVFERFDAPARRAMMLAFREARRGQHEFVGSEHVLFGLLRDGSSAAVRLLRLAGVSPDALLNRVEGEMLEFEVGAAFEQFPLSPAVRRVFDYALQEAGELGQTLAGPEHLLIGLLREESCEAAHTLRQAGAGLASVRAALTQLVPAELPERLLQPEPAPPAAWAESSAAALSKLVAQNAGVKARDVAEAEELAEASEGRDLPVKTPRELIEHVVAVETQLRRTQLLLGATLGLLLGIALGGSERWGLGLLLALGALAIAAVRSSLLGAWMGFIGGVMLPTFAPDPFNDQGNGTRLFCGAVGALLGSFLGDFWRPKSDKKEPQMNTDEHREEKAE